MKSIKAPARRLGEIVAGVGILFIGGMLFMSSPASADAGPHVSTAGNTSVERCAGCHRAHTAKATNLLLVSQVALCTTCHGTAGTGASTNVSDGVAYNNTARGAKTGALRGGGFTNALINSGAAVATGTKTVPVLALTTTAASTSAHSIDGSAVTAWGNGVLGSASTGTSVNLMCTSCHDPHGNGNFRALRAIPTGSGAAGVTIADTAAAAKTYTTTNYWATDVSGTETGTQFITNISSWCSTCHTRYLASTNSFKTNSGDATYTFRHMSSDQSTGGPNCITCHVAHGSNAVMNGANTTTTTTPDGVAAPSGNSKLLRVDNRGTCNMCHNV